LAKRQQINNCRFPFSQITSNLLLGNDAKAMRLMKLHIFIALIWVPLLTCGPAQAEPPRLAGELAIGLYSDYVFRGRNLYDDISLQPSVSTSYFLGNLGSLSGNIWSHLPLGGKINSQDIKEVDFTLVHDISFEPLTSSIGHTWFTYFDNEEGPKDTGEFFVAASGNTILHPTFSYYYDYRAKEASHYEISLDHSFAIELPKHTIGISPYVGLGFSTRSDPSYDKEGLAYTNYGIAFEVVFSSYRVSPNLSYTQSQDKECDNQFWFGITIGKLY
jgi:hypothetical protein